MRKALVAVLLLTLAACTAGPGMRGGRDLRPTANPSAVIATELAFARTAQEKGQWTAFREFAADDAVMFVPEPVKAQDWLRRQADPPQAIRWQPHQVWSSCDGTLAVTRGAWQRPDGSVGYFTTVWERKDNRDDYKWVLDQGDVLTEPLQAPEFVQAEVADCEPAPGKSAAAAEYDAELTEGDFFLFGNGTDAVTSASRDGTLAWSYAYTPSGDRRLKVALRRSGELVQVLNETVGDTASE